MNLLLKPPKKAQEYNIYKLTIRQPADDGLIVGRFEVAAATREAARNAGERWCMDRGMHPGFNCSVHVIRKMLKGEWITVLVAQ